MYVALSSESAAFKLEAEAHMESASAYERSLADSKPAGKGK
jgi:hypothetical protein